MKHVKLAAAALVACLFAGQAQAQTGTRVAVINVGEVFQKYEKAKSYKADIEKILGPKKAEAETLKKTMLEWDKTLKSGKLKEEDKARYIAGIKDCQRKLEDLDAWVRANVTKMQEGQIITLYKDLCDKIAAVAKANGVHLVLGYGDTTEDAFNIFNINRKMSGMDLGCTVPLFFVEGADLTQAVVNALNKSLPPGGGGIIPAGK